MSDAPIRNTFVYLVGFAGTGKLTIARALVREIDAIIVDNHWINNPIFGLIDPDGKTPLPESVWTQVWRVHEAVIETIATLAKPGRNFVFTHDGIEGDSYDRDKFVAIRSAAERRHASLFRCGCSAKKRNSSGASSRPDVQPCSRAPTRHMRWAAPSAIRYLTREALRP